MNLNNRLESVSPQATQKKKKTSVRVKWADHFGGDLAESRLIEGENIVQEPAAAASAESWSDRKKRDREKEKKLLLTMKYVLSFQQNAENFVRCSILIFLNATKEIETSR